jgi:hypothetical protein
VVRWTLLVSAGSSHSNIYLWLVNDLWADEIKRSLEANLLP